MVANAYVVESSVQSTSQTEVDETDKKKDDKELQDYLDSFLNDDEKKSLTASGTTGIKASTTNIIIGAIMVFVLGLIGVGAFRKLKNNNPK